MGVRSRLGLFALGGALLVPAPSTHGAEPLRWTGGPASVRVTHRWVDSNGKVSDVTWRIESEWRWVPNPDKGSRGQPDELGVIRSWLEIPAELKIRELGGSASVLSTKQDSPQAWNGAPFQPAAGKAGIAIDSEAALTEVSLKLETSDGKRREVGLILQTESSGASPVIHPGCGDLGVQAFQSAPFKGVFAALYCQRQGDQVDTFLFGSDDSELRIQKVNPGLVEERPKNRKLPFVRLSFTPPPPAGKPETQTLARLRFSPSDGSPEHEIRWVPPTAGKPWSAGTGLGLSFVGYSESARSTSVSQLGITLKGEGAYRPRKTRLELGANVFLTLVPLVLSSSPTGLPGARFLGINGRVAYLFPAQPDRLRFSAALGYYALSMIVSQSRYGIQMARGPQVFGVMRSPESAGRAYSTYLKYAILSDQAFAPKPSNFELAVGGSLRLNPANPKWPLSLASDLSYARFEASDLINKFDLFTLSLGTQLAF